MSLTYEPSLEPLRIFCEVTNHHDQAESTNLGFQICLDRQYWRVAYSLRSPKMGAEINFGEKVK